MRGYGVTVGLQPGYKAVAYWKGVCNPVTPHLQFSVRGHTHTHSRLSDTSICSKTRVTGYKASSSRADVTRAGLQDGVRR